MNGMIEEKYRLDRDIYHLLKDEPFFALLSRQLDKRADETIPTAGIKYNPERIAYELIYNPKFMQSLSDKHKKWVMMHELYHASLGHCQHRKLSDLNRQTANVAMDLAINSLSNMIDNAPEFVLMPGRGQFEDITMMGMATEWYANHIKKEQEKDPDKYRGEGDDCEGGEGQGNGQGQFDDHSDFGQGDLTEEEAMGKQIADKKLQDAIGKAVNECDVGDGKGGEPKGWGTVSHKTIKEIRDAVKNAFKLDPKKVLASFIKASVAADKKTSVTKRNRRLPGRKFGRRTQHRANIAISIDQSGSVSDELLARVFEWLNDFAKFASFTVIPFDHRVFEEKVYVWKKGEKRKRERVLCGGTDFSAPSAYVNKRSFDGHIIVTDMLAGKPIRSGCQRLWLTDRYGARCPYFKPVGERLLVLD